MPVPLAAISAGENVACGLTSDGRVFCWGTNEQGQLGLGDTTLHRRPAPVKTTLRFVQLSVGAAGGTCGVTTDRHVACWGRNDGGQLGTGDESSVLTPQVTRLTAATKFDEVSVGNGIACGRTTSHRVVCWGSPGDALGVKETSQVSVVEPPLAVAERAAMLSMGFKSSCLVNGAHQVFCWGVNTGSVLGRPRAAPTEFRFGPIAGRDLYDAVSVGAFACAITTTRALDCWGAERRGIQGRVTDFVKASTVERVVFE